MADRTPEGYRIDTCRSCNAPIIWATTTGRALMPVDVEPVDDGNVELHVGESGRAYATVLTGPSLFGGPLRKSHFASCEQADEWRRRG